MVRSRHFKVASLLPRLSEWIPRQNCCEVVNIVNILTTGDKDDIVNRCRSQLRSWCWKLATIPPLQLAATSVNRHLVAKNVGIMDLQTINICAELGTFENCDNLYLIVSCKIVPTNIFIA